MPRRDGNTQKKSRKQRKRNRDKEGQAVKVKHYKEKR